MMFIVQVPMSKIVCCLRRQHVQAFSGDVVLGQFLVGLFSGMRQCCSTVIKP
jgi:hypothetical protein